MALLLCGFRPLAFFSGYFVTSLLKDYLAGVQTDIPQKHGDICINSHSNEFGGTAN